MIQIFNSKKSPDFIGDIHGHLDSLVGLLKKLGYKKKDDIYVHNSRIPIFLGDYINRGPDVFGVLKLVREMQISGNAYAIMGNHEFNFLAYHYKSIEGVPFRPNTERYLGYIRETKEPLERNGQLEIYLDWISSLPLIVKNDFFNAVHAEWSEELELKISTSKIQKLDQNGMRSIHTDGALLASVSSIIRGSEFEITKDFLKKYNFIYRQEKERIVWWGNNRTNQIKDWLIVDSPNHEILVEIIDFHMIDDLNEFDKPVFFGHYWLSPLSFGLLSDNVCCLDFSVANGGFIGAYQFNNEEKLISKNLFHS